MKIQSTFYYLALVLVGCTAARDTATLLPQITFAIPDNATSASSSQLSLQSPTGSNVLTNWGTRMERVVEYVNLVLTKLEESKQVAATGQFSFTNAAGVKMSGKVEALADDATYTQQAVLCANDALFLHVKWNAAKDKVRAVRDFNVNSFALETTADLKTEIVYDASTTTKTLNVYSYGTPWALLIPTDVSSDATEGGSHLGEVLNMTLDASGNFTCKGVNAWTSAGLSSYGGEGDSYLTGKLNADGSGLFLANRLWATSVCTAGAGEIPFNEDADAPNYCFLGTIATDASVSYSAAASIVTTNWTEASLKAVGVAKDEDIKVVSFDEGIVCP